MNGEQVDLFGVVAPDPIDPVPGEPHNAHLQPKRRRRTDVVADRIAVGRHPLTGGPLHPGATRDRDRDSPVEPFTCGACVHRQPATTARRSYPKCMIPTPGVPLEPPADALAHPGDSLADAVARSRRWSAWYARLYARVSRSDATDVRAWWPACPAYSPKEPS